jgi:hypothetical protein
MYLSGLTRLTINYSTGKLYDSVITNLTNLEYLNIVYKVGTDRLTGSGLKSLVNLKTLKLGNRPREDEFYMRQLMTSIYTMTNLTKLHLDGVYEINNIHLMTQLIEFKHGSVYPRHIHNMTNLKKLYFLENSDISESFDLYRHTNLRSLCIRQSFCTFYGFENLVMLRKLQISTKALYQQQNRFDLNVINNLTDLSDLYIKYESDICMLSNLTNLTKLRIYPTENSLFFIEF